MKTIWIATKLLLVMTVLTGVIYPLVVTGVAKLIFPKQAEGSLIIIDGKTVGSELIGQNITDTKYFWSRPSAITYNPMPSSGSNLGPTSKVLKTQIDERAAKLREAHGTDKPIPEELLCASGSGLDPHISKEAALYQLERVATARQLDTSKKNQLLNLIDQLNEPPDLGILGESRINVLKLNLGLDSLERMN